MIGSVMRPQVFGLIYTHANSALRPASLGICATLQERGYDASILDLTQAEDFATLNRQLAAGLVAFCFGMQGVGSTLKAGEGQNLWSAARVPFIGVHYDSPCYNPFNHFNESLFVANLYHCESFLDIKQRYLPSAQVSTAAPYRFTGQAMPSPIPFAERPIRILYLKTGGDNAELTDYFNSLPPAIRDGIWDRLAVAAKSPNLQLCDLARDIFAAANMPWEKFERQFWGIVQSMDIYLRQQRAQIFVEWLRFQKGAVIIGDGWDFIDKDGAQAEFRPSIDIKDTWYFYHRAQFVANTNPYGRDIIHERVVLGLMYGNCVLSDTNAWWGGHFKTQPALIGFDWVQPLDEQLQPRLASATAETAATGPEAAGYFVDADCFQSVIDCAQRVRVLTAGR